MKLLLIDDHLLFTEALALLLSHRMPGVGVLSARSLDEAAALRRRHADIGLVLLDLGLRGSAGVQTLQRWRAIDPVLPVVVVSADDGPQTVQAVLAEGAAAFVPKLASADELAAALARFVDAAATRDAGPAAVELSQRQREVLGLLAGGASNKEIGRLLGLSEATVKTHLVAIFRKLEVETRTQAAIAAARLGLGSAPAREGVG